MRTLRSPLRDEEEDAVVLALLADAPLAAELVAVIGDVGALQVRHGDDDDLVRRFLLEGGELVGERRRGCRIEQPGGVDHASGEGGKSLGTGRHGERQRDQQRREDSHRRHADEGWPCEQRQAVWPGRAAGPQHRQKAHLPKSTLGGVSEPGVAVKACIGSLPE